MSRYSRPVKALLTGAAMMLAACETTDVAPIASEGRGNLETDEAGIWRQVDKAEKQLQTSGVLEKDAELNAYVNKIVCDVAGPEFCADIRVYVVKQPFFNATMSPNGMMEIWTGLMLRAENEAQLAFVIGHEIAHYRQRHSLQQWREIKNASNASMIIGLAGALAGVPEVATLGDLALASQLFGYGRDKEREADTLGFDYARNAGYDGTAGADMWQYLIDEVSQSTSKRKRKRFAKASIFSTHPVSSERVETLTGLASERPGGTLKEQQYVQKTNKFLAQWLDDDLVRRDFGEHLFLIENLMERGTNLGLLHFQRAEAYRLRREDGDQELAKADYQAATKYADAPAESWEGLGNILRKEGEDAQALAAYQTFLSKNPNAKNRKFIEQFIVRLGG